ncbi:hypothetical protein Q5424_04095 [Conexibacter sp. JD483]|uniref:hypothetical protein n=1 Tax=unclassified Conexibacter TaxID=2627773 RepID=UPI00271B21C5|nr:MULTISPECIES: hypothetical protein [unclassified Conexibacter]MDO8184987.1 hypothetical protein [Conexibacter sp. CPCC 205706]MDO8198131.1 hypothetical protein [Conexibacter sp. CPCC 205762]MDR9368247.1 hypothetical protein [Conexibacter sp. JD483]
MSEKESPVKWSVRAMKVGHWTAVPGPELHWMSHWDEWQQVDVLMLVARSDDGRVALVNTGPGQDYLPFMNAHWARVVREDCSFDVAPEQRIEAILAANELTPDDVDYVICTPFQAYTVGNLPLFERARICLSRRGWDFFFQNPYPNHPHDYRPMVFPPRVLEWLVYEAHDRIVLLDDEHELAPGLRTFFTGAHHRASIAVDLDTANGRVIASDAAFLYENVEQSTLLGINESMYEALDAYARFRRDADHFVPLCDGRVFDRHPGGVIA